MTESLHEHDEDDCARALAQVQAFLHHELDGSAADLIRAHLDACEACLESYDIEATITRLIQRCCPPQQASASLRMRIIRMSLHSEDVQP